MSISTKIAAPVWLLALLLIAGFSYIWLDFYYLDARLSRGARAVETINRLSTRLEDLAAQRQTRLLSYRFSQDPAYLTAMRRDRERLEEVLTAFQERVRTRQGAALVRAYRANRRGVDQLERDLVEAIRSGDEMAIARAFSRWQAKARTLDALLADLLAYARAYPEQTLASIAASRKRFAAVMAGVALAMAGLVLASLVYYRRLIGRPLQRLTGAAERIAQGQLDTRVPRNGSDEIGRLGQAFGFMTEKLVSANRALQQEVVEKSRELAERRRIARRLRQANQELQQTKAGLEREVRQRQESQRQLFAEKERAQVTLMSIGDAVITTDTGGRIERMNPVAEQLTGWIGEEAAGRALDEVFVVVDEERQRLPSPVEGCLRSEGCQDRHLDAILIARDQTQRYIADSAAPIRGRDGEVLGAVVVFHDVTESREMARRIQHQARHDALTGLINRHEFERRLNRALLQAQGDGVEHSLLYLDLDQFKIINDTCGHMAGDELLRQITAALGAKMRSRDTFARLGGDEFGMLLEHCHPDQGLQIANELRAVVETFRFTWERRTFSIGVSIGLVPVNHHSESLAQLLSLADTACYAAKEAGRNRVYVADERGLELRQRRNQLEWVARIRQAVEDDRLILRYQDIAPLRSNGDGEHYEILLSLDNGGGELSPPGAFLPAAERYNLMPALDRWVVERVFGWLADHPGHLQQLGLCAINLSGHSLGSDEFRDFVAQRFRHYGTPPHKICFEITETVAVTNLAKTLEFIDTFRALGCRFSLDDFGSGFSSYTYLKNMPVDFLKIDGTFVRAMANDAMDYAMVESINRIGHVLGKQTIAEFVEDQAILGKARELGVDYVQGYGIAMPRPLSEFGRQSRAGRA